MTYFDLFAKCLAIATKIPVEDVMEKFSEYSAYQEPHPDMLKEAPEEVVRNLLSIAESHPEAVISFGIDGIPAALNRINGIVKQ